MTEDRVEPGQTVIVEDGVISVIGPVDLTPLVKDIVVIDGTDRYLLPGLTEMHAHIPDAASPELNRVMALFVANGVTAVRGCPAGSSFAFAFAGRFITRGGFRAAPVYFWTVLEWQFGAGAR